MKENRKIKTRRAHEADVLEVVSRGLRGITAKKVYELTSQIPKGKVSTYGAIATALNSTKGSRAVGQILRRNPTPIVVPCHRVVKSDGRIGGYGGAEGFPRKIRLLRSEGIEIDGNSIRNMDEVLFSDFQPSEC